mmetsp:Transcript_36073/g.66542  ORF Transcript_36073/g.66542 Transcript_36073/m.66542 type:complete len:108 (+) Transcript_36073:556-879(+)
MPPTLAETDFRKEPLFLLLAAPQAKPPPSVVTAESSRDMGGAPMMVDIPAEAAAVDAFEAVGFLLLPPDSGSDAALRQLHSRRPHGGSSPSSSAEAAPTVGADEVAS